MSTRGWEGDDEERSFQGQRAGGDSAPAGDDDNAPQDDATVAPPKTTTRRKRNLLNESHLLSDEGFKKIYATFPYQTSGAVEPGQEDKALNSLIRMYKQWAYDLYPGLNFEDFIDRTEALGRHQSVQGLMSDLRTKEMRRAFNLPDEESFSARDGNGSAEEDDAPRQQDEPDPEESGFIVPGGDEDDAEDDYSEEEAML